MLPDDPSDPRPTSAPDQETAGRLERRLREELSPDLEVLRPLGSDRSARVFLGRDRQLARLVVVKALDASASDSPLAERRFEREARSIASLSDPHVVTVHRFGRLSEGTPYLVLQYVPGRSAEERLVAEGPFPADEALRILAEVARALDAAHQRGIVHRDVRPANILLEAETGQAVLTGFGIAALLPRGDTDVTTLTGKGETLGTPEYLSPEQLRGEPVTDRTDVYALGVTAWMLLTGQGPYGDRTPHAIVSAHLNDEPRPLSEACPGLEPPVADLLDRCLSKTSARRPSASHLASRLADPEASAPGADPGRSGLFWRIRRRRLVQILAAYVAGGFAMLEGVDQLVGQEILPVVTYRIALVTVLGGLPVAAILGWYHGEKGAQRVQPLEVALLVAVGAAWLGGLLWVLLR